MNELIRRVQAEFARDFTLTTLRVAIILVACVFIGIALLVENKWILAGALAYLVLP